MHFWLFKTSDWLGLTNETELKLYSEVGAIRIIVIVVTDGSRVVITVSMITSQNSPPYVIETPCSEKMLSNIFDKQKSEETVFCPKLTSILWINLDSWRLV